MTGHFQSRYAIGEKVSAMGSPATVVAITFRESGVTYEVAFATGGANGFLDASEVGDET